MKQKSWRAGFSSPAFADVFSLIPGVEDAIRAVASAWERLGPGPAYLAVPAFQVPVGDLKRAGVGARLGRGPRGGRGRAGGQDGQCQRGCEDESGQEVVRHAFHRAWSLLDGYESLRIFPECHPNPPARLGGCVRAWRPPRADATPHPCKGKGQRTDEAGTTFGACTRLRWCCRFLGTQKEDRLDPGRGGPDVSRFHHPGGPPAIKEAIIGPAWAGVVLDAVVAPWILFPAPHDPYRRTFVLPVDANAAGELALGFDLFAMVGEEAHSERDVKLLEFADLLDNAFVRQGKDEDHTIEQTLDLAWKLLVPSPRCS